MSTYKETARANWHAAYSVVGLADALDTLVLNTLRGDGVDSVAQLVTALQLISKDGLIHAEALLSPEEMDDDDHGEAVASNGSAA